ncbi:FecR domain-containing protein [Ruegeria sp. ANG-R]|uniref:FecR family protein n=1 Tax=Ruegeria sp. ANG-R TaxID=1577903 RepID=UPI001F4CA4FE|nr:FecR domain-containing protein [Ruegeria sp. ANG-R]
MAWLRLLIVFVVLSALPVSAVASIGKVLSVKPGADVIRAGKKIRLRQGMEVASGDTISTDRSGVVQLLFVDETKIAVGPNARMILDVSMLRGNRKAKSFTVQALGGSFRFISGKSRKRAYSIKTPNATMAVRGTIFDMWITSENQSAMLVIEGTVQMCGLRGSCRSASRRCSLFATSSNGRVGRPADQDQYDKALQGGFPFIRSQNNLLPPFRVTAEGCSGAQAKAPKVESEQPERRAAQRQAEQRQAESPARERGRSESPGRASASAEGRSGTSASAGVSSSGEASTSVSASSGNRGGSGPRATATAGNASATAGW